MLEERVLIWKYNRGKADALSCIYEKYKDDLMTLASALLYDKSSAEDVVHDVFMAFIRSYGKLRVTESLKGYLTTWSAQGLSEYEVMKLAGHSSFSTTHQFYLSIKRDYIDKARQANVDLGVKLADWEVE